MKRNILLKTLKEDYGTYNTIQDAIKDVYSFAWYGVQFFVYIIEENGQERPYYIGNIALSLHRSNINETAKYYNVII